MSENNQESAINPLKLLGNKVEQQGLVVLNNATGIPIVGEHYLSPYTIVSLCVRGYVEAEFDLKPVVYRPNDFCIMQSGHVIKSHRFSDDYQVRMIVSRTTSSRNTRCTMSSISMPTAGIIWRIPATTSPTSRPVR